MGEAEENDEPMMDDLAIVIALLVTAILIFYILSTNRASSDTSQQEPTRKQETISSGATGPENLLPDDSDDEDDTDLLDEDFEEYLERVDNGLMNFTNNKKDNFTQTQEEGAFKTEGGENDEFSCDVDMNLSATKQERLPAKMEDESTTTDDLKQESVQLSDIYINFTTMEVFSNDNEEDPILLQQKIDVESEGDTTSTDAEGKEDDICLDETIQEVVPVAQESAHSEEEAETVQSSDSYAKRTKTGTYSDESREDAEDVQMPQESEHGESKTEATSSDVSQEPELLSGSHIEITATEIPSSTGVFSDDIEEDSILILQQKIDVESEGDTTSTDEGKEEEICLDESIQEVVPVAQESAHSEEEAGTVQSSDSYAKRTKTGTYSDESREDTEDVQMPQESDYGESKTEATSSDVSQEPEQLGGSHIEITATEIPSSTGVFSDDNEEDSILILQQKIDVESEGDTTSTDEGKEEEICLDESIQEVVPVAQESAHSEEEAGTVQSSDSYAKRTKTGTYSDESREDAKDVQMPQESDHGESKTEATSSDVSQEPEQLGGSHIEITATEIPSSTGVFSDDNEEDSILILQQKIDVESEGDTTSTDEGKEDEICLDESIQEVVPVAQESAHSEEEAGTVQSSDSYAKRTKTGTYSDESREDAKDVQMPQESEHAESKTEATTSDVSQEPELLSGSHIEITATEIPSSTGVFSDDNEEDSILILQQKIDVESEGDTTSTDEGKEDEICLDESIQEVVPVAQESAHSEEEARTVQSCDSYAKRTITGTYTDESREDTEDVQMPQESDHGESKTEATSSDVSQEPEQLGGSYIEITATEIPSVESTSALLQEIYHEQKETTVSSEVDSSSISPEAQIPTDHSTEKNVIPLVQEIIHAENEDEVTPTDLDPEYVRLSGSVIKRTWSVGVVNETSLSGPNEEELNDNTEGCISAAEVSSYEVSDLKSNESPSEENEDHDERFCHETQVHVPQTEQNGSEVENVQADEYNGQTLTSQSAQLKVSLEEETADEILE